WPSAACAPRATAATASRSSGRGPPRSRPTTRGSALEILASYRGIPGPGGVARGRAAARPARGAFAPHRQARAGVRAAAAAAARQELLAEGHARHGVGDERVGLVVPAVPRRASCRERVRAL